MTTIYDIDTKWLSVDVLAKLACLDRRLYYAWRHDSLSRNVGNEIYRYLKQIPCMSQITAIFHHLNSNQCWAILQSVLSDVQFDELNSSVYLIPSYGPLSITCTASGYDIHTQCYAKTVSRYDLANLCPVLLRGNVAVYSRYSQALQGVTKAIDDFVRMTQGKVITAAANMYVEWETEDYTFYSVDLEKKKVFVTNHLKITSEEAAVAKWYDVTDHFLKDAVYSLVKIRL